MSDGTETIDTNLRRMLQEHGKLQVSSLKIGPDQDLYALGLSSLATVSLMLAIEAGFDVEIPDEMLTRDNFRTLTALHHLVRSLRSDAA